MGTQQKVQGLAPSLPGGPAANTASPRAGFSRARRSQGQAPGDVRPPVSGPGGHLLQHQPCPRRASPVGPLPRQSLSTAPPPPFSRQRPPRRLRAGLDCVPNPSLQPVAALAPSWPEAGDLSAPLLPPGPDAGLTAGAAPATRLAAPAPAIWEGPLPRLLALGPVQLCHRQSPRPLHPRSQRGGRRDGSSPSHIGTEGPATGWLRPLRWL